MPLLPCQAMFGLARGDQIIEMVEAATGGPCPCIQGLTCPLMPAEDQCSAAAV
jgi:hypothetical protein